MAIRSSITRWSRRRQGPSPLQNDKPPHPAHCFLAHPRNLPRSRWRSQVLARTRLPSPIVRPSFGLPRGSLANLFGVGSAAAEGPLDPRRRSAEETSTLRLRWRLGVRIRWPSDALSLSKGRKRSFRTCGEAVEPSRPHASLWPRRPAKTMRLGERHPLSSIQADPGSAARTAISANLFVRISAISLVLKLPTLNQITKGGRLGSRKDQKNQNPLSEWQNRRQERIPR